jgi:predicted aspartyl protease
MKLKAFLKNKYTAVKLKHTNTNHFVIKAKINGTKGRFIIDTGASSTCIGSEFITKFKLHTTASDTKATGAGSIDIFTELSKNNSIQIGKWKKKNIAFVILDLNHINTALKNHHSKTVDGIIGADILKKGKAIIDYSTDTLHLKKEYFEY